MLVIVRDLRAGPRRLDALRRGLRGISTGALEARLVRMVAQGLLERRRYRAVPPRVELELTERGHALADVISELVRWELRTEWSQPREDEWVDVAACFRLVPFLSSEEEDAPDGELALTIAGECTDRYTFIRDRGDAILEQRPAKHAQAHIAATQQGWVEALSPSGSRAGLRVSGDEALATSFLGLFTAARD